MRAMFPGGQLPDLLTPAEAAAMLRVDVKTLARWEKDDRWPAGAVVRTLGGHRRYVTQVILAITRGEL